MAFFRPGAPGRFDSPITFSKAGLEIMASPGLPTYGKAC